MRGGSAPASTGWTCTRPQISIEIPSTRVCRPSSRPSRTRLARQTLNKTTSPKTPDTTPLKMCRPRPTGDSIAAMIRMAPAARNSAPAIRVRVSAPVLGWCSSMSPSPTSSPPPIAVPQKPPLPIRKNAPTSANPPASSANQPSNSTDTTVAMATWPRMTRPARTTRAPQRMSHAVRLRSITTPVIAASLVTSGRSRAFAGAADQDRAGSPSPTLRKGSRGATRHDRRVAPRRSACRILGDTSGARHSFSRNAGVRPRYVDTRRDQSPTVLRGPGRPEPNVNRTCGDPSMTRAEDKPTPPTVQIEADGRTVATAEIHPTGQPGVVHSDLHVESGHVPGGTRSRLVDAMLDLPEVDEAQRLVATMPLSDTEMLQRVRERCEQVEARPAGATKIVEARLEPEA